MCRLRSRIYTYKMVLYQHRVFRFICQWVPFPTLTWAIKTVSVYRLSTTAARRHIRGSHTKLLLFHPVCGRSRTLTVATLAAIIYRISNIICSVSFSPRPFSAYALIMSTRA